MRITIRDKNLTSAIIISFKTNRDKFDSDYERIKFFKELHGWKQIVPNGAKRYVYRRKGLLDDIPHTKLADSVFAIAIEHMKRMEEFFNEWEDKVDYEIMEIMANKRFFIRKEDKETEYEILK